MNVKSLIGLLALVVVLPPSQAFSQVPPHIEFFSPQNSVKNVRQVAVRFSEPMVPFGSPKVETEVFAIEKGNIGVRLSTTRLFVGRTVREATKFWRSELWRV